jgi:mono/diheme cytochrome c family protein
MEPLFSRVIANRAPAARTCGLVFLILFAVLSVSRVSAQQVTAADVDSGRQAFAASGCSVCHGEAGRGTDAGPSLAAGELSLAEFIAGVRRSVRTMPAFGPEALSDQTAGQIFAYLQSREALEQPEGRAEAGAELFASYGCYSCHANEAQGVMHGPRLGPNPISRARFSWYLRHPSANMPPYSETVLSEQELADIYAFVASRPEPPPLESIPLLAP